MRGKAIAIFASGTGTNANAIIQSAKTHTDFHVALVVTNKPTAGVIQVAESNEVPFVILPKSEFNDEELVLAILEGYEIDVVVLAGWLLLVPAFLVKAFKGRMLNIHPALLPKFGGKGMWGHHVHEAVHVAGEKESGITIHFVNEHFDEGEIIAHFAVSLDETDGPAEIESKVRGLELLHYPEVIRKFCNSLKKMRTT